MSKTIVDMPKVTQMLDAGFHVKVFKNQMGSYSALARHPDPNRMYRVREALIDNLKRHIDAGPDVELAAPGRTPREMVKEFDFDGPWLITDDFTPEQAMTRLAYKIFGQILGSEAID